MLGFGRIEECKRVLNKHFTKDIEYKIIFKKMEEKFAPLTCGAKNQNENFAPRKKRNTWWV